MNAARRARGGLPRSRARVAGDAAVRMRARLVVRAATCARRWLPMPRSYSYSRAKSICETKLPTVAEFFSLQGHFLGVASKVGQLHKWTHAREMTFTRALPLTRVTCIVVLVPIRQTHGTYDATSARWTTYQQTAA